MVQALRRQDLFKAPGVAETLDWAAALVELDAVALDPATVSDTLGVLLKYQDDIARIQGSKVQALIDQMRAELKAAAECMLTISDESSPAQQREGALSTRWNESCALLRLSVG